MNNDYLIKAGLSPEQALVYEILVKNGELSARKVHQKTPLKRGLVYKVLDQLVAIGLTEKKEKIGKVATFFPAHPFKLRDLAKEKEAEAKEAQFALTSILPALISDFNLVSGQPGISFFEGIEGLTKIYDDIIDTGKDIILFRSIYDDDHPELGKLVERQIKRQIEKGIHTLALTPLAEDTPISVINGDEKNLVKRRIIRRDKFILDSQIIIYGQKVAIVSLKNKLISTIIDNEDINNTWRTIFQYIWEKAGPESDKMLEKIKLSLPGASSLPSHRENQDD